ncbi:MAG TPA: hypothetical protein DCM07_09105 [Planctomycetaceae bacterium]|nr:hypothetical protein [Gimesia sp.]HAH44999.1 hypothetical protein [Planctomycetaceae bacterium]HBL44024.1 hypothetical protein [Planctomycetaceae bacterium]
MLSDQDSHFESGLYYSGFMSDKNSSHEWILSESNVGQRARRITTKYVRSQERVKSSLFS